MPRTRPAFKHIDTPFGVQIFFRTASPRGLETLIIDCAYIEIDVNEIRVYKKADVCIAAFDRAIYGGYLLLDLVGKLNAEGPAK